MIFFDFEQVSEIDIFDWSPATSDKNLMSIDDYCWTADTLFSTINSTPFPFPDPREIGMFQEKSCFFFLLKFIHVFNRIITSFITFVLFK